MSTPENTGTTKYLLECVKLVDAEHKVTFAVFNPIFAYTERVVPMKECERALKNDRVAADVVWEACRTGKFARILDLDAVRALGKAEPVTEEA